MKPLFNNQSTPKERVDFGDAVISNSKNNCEKCLLKVEGCKFVVNSINCEVAIKRMKKILSEKEDIIEKKEEGDLSPNLVEEEQQSVKDFLASLSSDDSEEVSNEEEDD